MHLILLYPTGRRVDAILLAASRDRMRLVVRRLNETLELHHTDGQWTSEDGTNIEIDSIVADNDVALPSFLSHLNQRVSRAH